MYTLRSKGMEVRLDGTGAVASLYNRTTCHEYVFVPGSLWKLIYREGERQEVPVFSRGQSFAAKAGRDAQGRETLELTYDGLQGDGKRLDTTLRLSFVLEDD